MDEADAQQHQPNIGNPAIRWGEAVAALVADTDEALTSALQTMLKQPPWWVYSRAHLLDALHDRLALHDADRTQAQVGRYARMGRWRAVRSRWAFWRQLRSKHDWERSRAREGLWLLTRTRRDERRLRTADLAPEQLTRFAALVRLGAAAEYLSEPEAVDAYTVLAEALRERCSSWSQCADAYAVGTWVRSLELDRDAERAADAATEERITDLSSPTGPWAEVAWDVPLPASTGLFFDALAESGGKDRHWKGPRCGWQQRINAELEARGVPPRGFA